MNKIAELARQIKAEQAKRRDEDEADEKYFVRLALEDEWIGGISYKGNSVSWSHSKAEKYGNALLAAWDELVKIGVPMDGETTVAQAIAKFCVRRTST
jgi:hypothetical protein